ncbi:cell division protein FtsL [Vibrio sinaloensis]|uniref:cell division protein FtsL n=1 Tax=Photobacterium sp. (strain ATCC 43367) TaxID=379097 RepID=UPI002045804B|nr:cell division protein FtsL [Vibrio sinaloensis]UPQ88467.1 cell division protein FtsL [Vibrio sinaloensis]
MSTAKPNLAKLIALDLLGAGRVPLIMLVLIFASAMGVVFTTHHTRQAVTEKDQALVERERLDNEWRNLLLEETALAEHSRVQDIAKGELEMKRPDSDKEVIVNLP